MSSHITAAEPAAETIAELERHLAILRDRAEKESDPLQRASWEDHADAVSALIAGVVRAQSCRPNGGQQIPRTEISRCRAPYAAPRSS